MELLIAQQLRIDGRVVEQATFSVDARKIILKTWFSMFAQHVGTRIHTMSLLRACVFLTFFE